MEWTPWYALDSEGHISERVLPASYIQFRYFVNLQADTRGNTTAIGGKRWDGRWRWTLQNPGGNYLFDQTNDISVGLMTLGSGGYIGGFGGVTLFTWWFNDAANKVYTEIPQPCYLVTGQPGGQPPEQLGLVRVTSPNVGTLEIFGETLDEWPMIMRPASHIGPNQVELYFVALGTTGEPRTLWGRLRGGAYRENRQDRWTLQADPPNSYPNQGVRLQDVEIRGGNAGDEIEIWTDGWVTPYRERGMADPSSYPPGTTWGDPTPESSGLTDYRVIVAFWYYTQGYKITVPRGSYMNIPFHTVGASLEPFVQYQNLAAVQSPPAVMLPEFAGVAVRTVRGANVASTVSLPGHQHIIVPSSTRGRIYTSRDEGHTFTQRELLQKTDSPTLVALADGSLLMGCLQDSRYRLFISHDDSITWELLSSWKGQPVANDIWTSDYTGIQLGTLPSGLIVSAAVRSGKAWCRTSRDGFMYTRLIGEVPSGALTLTCDQDRGIIYVSDGGSVNYRSEDEGYSWASTTL